VAEGEDAAAFDVGHRALRAHAVIAGQQQHADHGSRLQVRRIAHRRRRIAAAGDHLARFQAELP
jgi:hypothetical protein